MRIGSGSLRGRKLHAPRGLETRPTSSRLKKSLFDVLAPTLPDARVLDLYAGAGALALEAISRGAADAVLVERSRPAVAAIRRNVEELGLEARCELLAMDVLRALRRLAADKRVFDVVFADPPYAAGALDAVLDELDGGAIVGEHGRVVVEHHHKHAPAERHGALERFRTLDSGESCFSLYRRLC